MFRIFRSRAVPARDYTPPVPRSFTEAESARVTLCIAHARTESANLVAEIIRAESAVQAGDEAGKKSTAGLLVRAKQVTAAHKRLSSAMYARCSRQFQGIQSHIQLTAFHQIELLCEDIAFFTKRGLSKQHIRAALLLAKESLHSLGSASEDMRPGYRDCGFTLPRFTSNCEQRLLEYRVELCRTQWQFEMQKMRTRLDAAVASLTGTNERAVPQIEALKERLAAVQFYYDRYATAHFNNTGRLLGEHSLINFDERALRRAKDLLEDVTTASKAKTQRDILAASLTATQHELRAA
jgi:hypothetical protein